MAPTKSQRQRLQRQLEFYLSASNLRQDKFLQQHMDGDGFLPVELFLSFNRVKALNATKRLVVEAADKSPLLRVALVSLPRFQSSRQFKGFAFVEFASADDATAALEALAASEPPAAELGGVKGWRKTQWLDLKRRLKAELAASSAVDGERHAAADGEPKKQAAGKATAGHVRFRDEDEDEDAAEGPKQQEQEQEQQEQEQESAKRRRTARENE
ncbi:hypothetical protein ATCC90586_007249 [Pythium insidiosum]|nr:hypothetical protein ATCC90586_007249 [Pythium insidiosum]